MLFASFYTSDMRETEFQFSVCPGRVDNKVDSAIAMHVQCAAKQFGRSF